MNKKIFTFLIMLSLLFSAHSFAADYNGHWAAKYIEEAFAEKIAFGDSNSDFNPDRDITRAEFITLLINHMMKYENINSSSLFTSFGDVSPNAPYFPHIVIAEGNGIVKGFSDGGFHPGETLTREDALVFVCRAYNVNPPYEEFYVNYTDLRDISSYAKKYMQFSVNNKIIVGYGNNTLRPKNPVSRAEALVILDKFKNISFNTSPEFVSGYPKISPAGTVNNITLELKTTVPCTIFFKAVKKDNLTSYLTPKKEEITNILAVVSDSDTVVSSDILLNSYDDEYIIFLMPVSENGSVGTIKRIKDVKALAYEKGDGSKNNPYIIYNESQLSHIRYCQNNYFKLANDIVLSAEWTPINASSGYFLELDGDGHTIYNLNISDGSETGLFSHLKGGTVKNLCINGNISASSNAGMFAGILEDGTVSGCVATGYVSASSSNCGGIVGINKGKIVNSLSALYSVSAAVNAGGIAGSNSGIITSCVCAVAEVKSDMYSGCISGINSGEISSCVSANLLTQSLLTYSSGRISCNKDDGITNSNYVYEHTKTNLLNMNSNKNNSNGEEISWNDIVSAEFYESHIDSSFFKNWKISDNRDFVLPVPSSFSDIETDCGKTPYSPEKITSSNQIYSLNADGHYILTRDITLNKTTDLSEFCGTFDGNNHTVFNLNGSLFSKINSDAAIRNLKIKNSKNACIAVQNYGNIENCTVNGTHSLYAETLCSGGIASENYGNITNCDSSVNFTLSAASLTVGGLAGHNEGFIDDCSYIGNITVNKYPSSLSALGGICGFNSGGFVYNCFSNAEINVNSSASYTGGICGILASGEIFKCSSEGTMKIISDTAYSGGISAMSSDGLIYSCFSALNITSDSLSAYTGGICGFNSNASIQSTYSVNTLYQAKKSEETALYAGGICGFNEYGFISDNAAINPWIVSDGISFAIGFSPEEYLNNNYSYFSIKESPSDGTLVKLNKFYSADFWFLPVYKGGKLGWSYSLYEDGAIWTNSRTSYKFPVLKDVKNQNGFTNPVEFE